MRPSSEVCFYKSSKGETFEFIPRDGEVLIEGFRWRLAGKFTLVVDTELKCELILEDNQTMTLNGCPTLLSGKFNKTCSRAKNGTGCIK
jgi:hypothetical protein